MNAPTFSAWIANKDERRRRHIPYADRVVPLIAQAGTGGMTRTQLSHAVRLSPTTLDQLLDALVRFGLLTVAKESDSLVYRSSGVIQNSTKM